MTRFLYRSTLSIAVALLAAVLTAPFVPEPNFSAGLHKLHGLYARDVVVRRTSLASAFGLIVTACVFFRRPIMKQPSQTAPDPTQGGVGA